MEAQPKFGGRVSTLARHTYILKCKPAYREIAHSMAVPMSNIKRTSEVSITKKRKIMVVEEQRNISMQAPVCTQSLDLSAAYLHSVIQTSITPDSPHDDGPDEQCQAHVEGQCREKREKKS